MSERPPPQDAARRLTILTTEHWSLLATRSLVYTESFSRVSTFLSVLSAAMVALALVAQVDHFGRGSRLIAVLLLVVVLLLGVSTIIRLTELNAHDAWTVQGMNMLRRAYLDIEPQVAHHFLTSSDPSLAGVIKSMGIGEFRGVAGIVHALAVLPIVLSIVLAGVIAVVVGLVGGLLGAGNELALALSVGGFVVGLVCLGWYSFQYFRSSTAVTAALADAYQAARDADLSGALPDDGLRR